MINYFQVILLAVALSLDAFSVSISVGINCKNKILKIILIFGIGICHYIFPCIGMLIGKTFLAKFVVYSSKLLGIILLLLSLEMIYNLFSQKEELNYSIINIIFLIITVSLDSFLTGIGLFNIKSKIITLLTFSITSSTFTLIGINIGRIIKNRIEKYSSFISIMILLILSVKYLLF